MLLVGRVRAPLRTRSLAGALRLRVEQLSANIVLLLQELRQVAVQGLHFAPLGWVERVYLGNGAFVCVLVILDFGLLRAHHALMGAWGNIFAFLVIFIERDCHLLDWLHLR